MPTYSSASWPQRIRGVLPGSRLQFTIDSSSTNEWMTMVDKKSTTVPPDTRDHDDLLYGHCARRIGACRQQRRCGRITDHHTVLFSKRTFPGTRIEKVRISFLCFFIVSRLAFAFALVVIMSCIIILQLSYSYSSHLITWTPVCSSIRSLHLRSRILASKLLHNPSAELLPLVVPVADVLGLDTIAILCTVNVSHPVLIGLVFKVWPPQTVLSQGALLFVSKLKDTLRDRKKNLTKPARPRLSKPWMAS